MSIDKRGKNTFRFRVQFQGVAYSMTYYGKDKDAKLAHDQFKLAVKQGKYKQTGDNITFGELWDLYLENKDLQASTKIAHFYQQKKYSHLLGLPVKEITPLMIEKLSKEPQSTLGMIKIKSVLNYAVELDLIPSSPFKTKIKKQTRAKYEQLLTLEEIGILMDALFRYENEKIGTILLLELMAGARISELRVLKKEDIECLDEIKITKQYKVVDYREKNGSLTQSFGEGSTKSTAGNRTIFVPEALQERLKCVVELTEPNGYIFSATGEKPYSVLALNKNLARICKKANLPKLTTHKLRALFATLSIYSGIDILSISKTLGHSRTAMTETYLRSLEEQTKQSFKKMDYIIEKIQNKP